MDRNATREKLLSSKRTPVQVIEVEGIKVGFKRPLVRERDSLIAKLQGKDQDLKAAAVLLVCVHPETNEPLFEDQDIDVLMGQEAGGIFDQLVVKAVETISPNSGEEEKKLTKSS